MTGTTNSTATTVGANVNETTTTTTHLSSSTATTSKVATTTTSTTTTTEGVPALVGWASTINQVVLTEIFLHATTLTAGVIMVVVGKKITTLLAGNLVLAIFLGMLMKSGQEENPGLSQLVIWPIIVAVVAFSLVSGLLYCYQRAMVGVITGLTFAAVGLAITVAAALSPIPWGLAAAVLLYILGHVAAAKSVDRPTARKAMYKLLSALLGGFLIANGAQFFVYERDFAEEIASAVVRAMKNPEEGAQSVADDVRPQVAGWLGLSVFLLCAHYFIRGIWLKYRAKKLNKGDTTKGAHTKDDKTGEAHSFAGAV